MGLVMREDQFQEFEHLLGQYCTEALDQWVKLRVSTLFGDVYVLISREDVTPEIKPDVELNAVEFYTAGE